MMFKKQSHLIKSNIQSAHLLDLYYLLLYDNKILIIKIYY